MKPVRISARLLRSWPLPALDEDHGKVGRGRVVVLAGSNQVPGAAVLAAIGVLRAGAGTVRIATVRACAMHIAVELPEALVVGLPTRRDGEIAAASVPAVLRLVEDCDTLLVGPGMRDADTTQRVLAKILQRRNRPRVVVDAGALQACPRATKAAPFVLTPHRGEAAEMLDVDADEIGQRPIPFAMELAKRFHSVVVLKGARTIIAAPDGECYENVAGNIGLGTSGSGDTLAGVIAGLCARGAPPIQAAAWGVHAHAKAGERLARTIGPVGYLARELLAEVPALICAWSR